MTVKFITVKGPGGLAAEPFYLGIPQHERTMSKRETYEHCAERTGYKPTAVRAVFMAVAEYIRENQRKGNITYIDGVASIRNYVKGAFAGLAGPWVKGVNYFYARLYLDGTSDSDGRLTSANSINVRLYKGEAFRLTLDDFSFTFDGAGDAVKIDSIYGDTTDAGGNTYGQLVAGAPVKINGRNLYAAGDTDKVTFTEAGGGSTVEVTDFATQSETCFRSRGRAVSSRASPTA